MHASSKETSTALNDVTETSSSTMNVSTIRLESKSTSSPNKRQRTESSFKTMDPDTTDAKQSTSSDSTMPSDSISSAPLHSNETSLDTSTPSMCEQRIVVRANESEEVVVKEQEEGRSRRERKPINYGKRFFMSRNTDTPRWYTQSYIVFLALREHPDHCLPRTALIHAALALDEKISRERNLPRVFRSKTPENSASAVLTINADRYYIPYKPEGSRSTWFKLAYTPGNFDQAYEEYKKWMTKLIQHDWLYCFGIPLAGSTISTATTTDEGSLLSSLENNTPSTEATTDLPPTLTMDDKENTPSDEPTTTTTNPAPLPVKKQTKKKKKLTMTKTKNTDKPSSSRTLTTQLKQQPPPPVYQLDQLDLSQVPKQWQDIVRIGPSTIPNGGQGLFAARELPYNTPLGFYFGVPMTEFEFDSIKEHVGRASEYSILYRRTVLDATNDQGEPYTLPNASTPLCPFHYMNEAKDETMANILFVEGIVVNQVICWSKRIIQPGEELLVWYGTDVNRYWKDDKE